MTWFDIIKERPSKTYLPLVKETLTELVNKNGYIIIGKDLTDFYNLYLKKLIEYRDKEVRNSEEYKKFDMYKRSFKTTYKYNGSRPYVTRLNNYAKDMFEFKIVKNNVSALEDKRFKGIIQTLTGSGSVYFKDLDTYNNYIDNARTIAIKRRQTQQKRDSGFK